MELTLVKGRPQQCGDIRNALARLQVPEHLLQTDPQQADQVVTLADPPGIGSGQFRDGFTNGAKALLAYGRHGSFVESILIHPLGTC